LFVVSEVLPSLPVQLRKSATPPPGRDFERNRRTQKNRDTFIPLLFQIAQCRIVKPPRPRAFRKLVVVKTSSRKSPSLAFRALFLVDNDFEPLRESGGSPCSSSLFTLPGSTLTSDSPPTPNSSVFLAGHPYVFAALGLDSSSLEYA